MDTDKFEFSEYVKEYDISYKQLIRQLGMEDYKKDAEECLLVYSHLYKIYNEFLITVMFSVHTDKTVIKIGHDNFLVYKLSDVGKLKLKELECLKSARFKLGDVLITPENKRLLITKIYAERLDDTFKVSYSGKLVTKKLIPYKQRKTTDIITESQVINFI